LGSVKSDERERMTLRMERAGDQLFLRMSRQIPPLSDCEREREREKVNVWFRRRRGGSRDETE